MSDSVLSIIQNASRPYVPFKLKINDEEVELLARRPSSAQAQDAVNAFTEAYSEARRETEENEGIAISMRSSFDRLSTEKIVDFILMTDRSEYLAEASNELDDKPVYDPKVIALADEKQEQEKVLLMAAPREELIDQALTRRKDIMARTKANQAQVNTLLLHTVFTPERSPLFPNIEAVHDLSFDILEEMLNVASKAIGGTQSEAPLDSPKRKSSRGRMSSRNTSEVELTTS